MSISRRSLLAGLVLALCAASVARAAPMPSNPSAVLVEERPLSSNLLAGDGVGGTVVGGTGVGGGTTASEPGSCVLAAWTIASTRLACRCAARPRSTIPGCDGSSLKPSGSFVQNLPRDVFRTSLTGQEDRLPPLGGKVWEGTPIPAPSDPRKDRLCQRYKRPGDQTSPRVHRARDRPRWCHWR